MTQEHWVLCRMRSSPDSVTPRKVPVGITSRAGSMHCVRGTSVWPGEQRWLLSVGCSPGWGLRNTAQWLLSCNTRDKNQHMFILLQEAERAAIFLMRVTRQNLGATLLCMRPWWEKQVCCAWAAVNDLQESPAHSDLHLDQFLREQA